jgi:hypothetical protein
MIPKPSIERCIYILAVVLSLVAVAATLASRSYSLENDVVYQGF